jgi:hypothetical protein
MGQKKKGGQARSAKADRLAAERAEKQREALSYRRVGYSFHDIAETMEISPSMAHRWVSEAIKAIPQQAADDVRRMMLDRLDGMMVGLMRTVEEDQADPSTINAILAIEDRRARLLGIYDLAYGEYEDPESRAGRMLGAVIAQIKADAPVLRPDGPIPLIPVL